MLKLKLTKVSGRELQAGDLFLSPLTGDKDINAKLKEGIGVSVYVRTEVEYPFNASEEHPVYKVKIIKRKN